MQLRCAPDCVDFIADDGTTAGRYHFADPFKPFVHPLRSPHGHHVSLAAPHDHKHHKGLMYGLRIPGLNFWEETPTLPGEKIGRQRHVAFTELREAGTTVSLTETLVWEPAGGGPAVFDETRRLACRRDSAGFRWEWETSLRARCATTLIQSQWSHRNAAGVATNYHGLGLRFRREFGGGTRNNALQLDDGPLHRNAGDTPFDFTTAMRTTPRKVTFIGSIDGTWPPPQVAVTIEQPQSNGLFVLETPFAFMALGPSNLAERNLAAEEILAERYAITVADR
jgi:hypothetical protein